MDLRANTAVDVLIGPFVDSTDGDTAETALTISQADVRLAKNGQNMAQKNDATAAVHDELGYYNCELDATDTNTEGNLVLVVHESGALPVRHEFNVMAEAAWDSLYVAKDTGFMDVNVKAVSEDTTAADNLESACDNYSATRGLTGTALPAAAADAAGGLMISDDGGWDADELYDAIITDAAGANVAADIIAVKAETALIVADTNELQTNQGNWATAISVDLNAGAINNASLGGNMEIVFETDFATNYNQTRDAWVTNHNDYIGAIPAAALGADCITAAKIAPSAITKGDQLAGLNDVSTAEVNAEMVDVMGTDTVTLPGQIAPPNAPTRDQMVGFLYKNWRNEKDQTATLWQLKADDGSTVDQKATVSESGGTATKEEIVSGP